MKNNLNNELLWQYLKIQSLESSETYEKSKYIVAKI